MENQEQVIATLEMAKEWNNEEDKWVYVSYALDTKNDEVIEAFEDELIVLLGDLWKGW